MSAWPIGDPGWPDWAASTASTASILSVFTASVVISSAVFGSEFGAGMEDSSGDGRRLARGEQRRAEERRAFIEHELDGDPGQHGRKPTLGAEGGEEAAVAEARLQLGCDAARDIH